MRWLLLIPLTCLGCSRPASPSPAPHNPAKPQPQIAPAPQPEQPQPTPLPLAGRIAKPRLRDATTGIEADADVECLIVELRGVRADQTRVEDSAGRELRRVTYPAGTEVLTPGLIYEKPQRGASFATLRVVGSKSVYRITWQQGPPEQPAN